MWRAVLIFLIPAVVIHIVAANKEFFAIAFTILAIAWILNYSRRQYQLEQHEATRKNIEKEESERRAKLRDSDVQDVFYEYKIDRHGNETLAMRYGIPNLKKVTEPYYYTGKGGVRIEDPTRARTRTVDANTIRLRKEGKVPGARDRYYVSLADFRGRKAIAVIEKGTEYVKTFYPIKMKKINGKECWCEDKDWFDVHHDFETTLKGNSFLSLAEIAKIHIEKIVGYKS